MWLFLLKTLQYHIYADLVIKGVSGRYSFYHIKANR